ncbi:MAG: hypothetical protein ABR569_06310 [Gaiellaceae bacterium]
MEASGGKHEFRVVIEGIELGTEHAHRINRAVQSAALQELAELEIEVDFGVWIPRKEWLGIWVGPLNQIERAGR